LLAWERGATTARRPSPEAVAVDGEAGIACGQGA
jgi:hypothetical protein